MCVELHCTLGHPALWPWRQIHLSSLRPHHKDHGYLINEQKETTTKLSILCRFFSNWRCKRKVAYLSDCSILNMLRNSSQHPRLLLPCGESRRIKLTQTKFTAKWWGGRASTSSRCQLQSSLCFIAWIWETDLRRERHHHRKPTLFLRKTESQVTCFLSRGIDSNSWSSAPILNNRTMQLNLLYL